MTYANYCGPRALAEYVGISRQDAALLLRGIIKRQAPDRRVRAATPVWALKSALIDTLGAVSYRRKIPRGQRTLAGWIYRNPSTRAIVIVTNHFVVVDQGCVVAGRRGLSGLRARVEGVLQ